MAVDLALLDTLLAQPPEQRVHRLVAERCALLIKMEVEIDRIADTVSALTVLMAAELDVASALRAPPSKVD